MWNTKEYSPPESEFTHSPEDWKEYIDAAMNAALDILQQDTESNEN